MKQVKDVFGAIALLATFHLACGLGLKGAKDELATKPPVMMVSFDKQYQSLWSCWAHRLAEEHSKQEVVVVSLDDETTQHVNQWKKNAGSHLPVSLYTKYSATSTTLQFSVWPSCYYSFVYFKAIRDYFLAGHEAVFKSDLDVILLTDPWDAVKNASDADIVTMPDSFPGGYGSWAFNTGFVLYRNTPAVMQLLNDIVAYSESGKMSKARNCNDQFTLTDFANKRGCHNFGPGSSHGEPENGFYRGNCGSIKVAGFADGAVRRGTAPCHNVADCKKQGIKAMHTRQGHFLSDICGRDAAKGPEAHN